MKHRALRMRGVGMIARRVLVWEPVKVLRDSLCEVLRGRGYRVTQAATFESLCDAKIEAAVCYVNARTFVHIKGLITHSPRSDVIVTIDANSEVPLPILLGAGVGGVVPRGGEPQQALNALEGLELGLSSCPSAALIELRRRYQAALIDEITAEERHWLCRVNQGTSLDVLAKECHFSARTLDRRLRRLYSKLGAESMAQAIAAAALWGLVDWCGDT